MTLASPESVRVAPAFAVQHKSSKVIGRHIGCRPLDIDKAAVLRHRAQGRVWAKLPRPSPSHADRILKEEAERRVPKGVAPATSQVQENRPPIQVA